MPATPTPTRWAAPFRARTTPASRSPAPIS
jgi:hypothetical protein